MGTLINSSESNRWLMQFELNDVPAARMLLNSLELVSLQQFESGIITLVERLCSVTTGKIALFAVDPNPALFAKARARTDRQIQRLRANADTENANERIAELEAKLAAFSGRASSAGRIDHILQQLTRRHSRRLSLNPSVLRMKAERVKHVALIDDIIGSGTGITEFWKAWAHPTLKSWLSFGYCKLWCLAYCSHYRGIDFALERIPPLKTERILTHRSLDTMRLPWDRAMVDLCRKYSSKTGKPHAALGFGKVMNPIIFQHGCPNDCPAILWDSTSPTWNAIFPNRSIPVSLYPHFDVDLRTERHAERLWRSGQYALAISLLESLKSNRLSPDLSDLLSVVALLVKGYNLNSLQSLLLLEANRIAALVDAAADLGLTLYDGTPTSYGRELLARSRQKFSPVESGKNLVAPESGFYYPSQLRGAQRNSSS